MEDFYITASPTSPEIQLRVTAHSLSIKGESYPENAAAFYGPVIERVQAFLDTCTQATVTVNISLAYFNSSSTKMLFSLFDLLNTAALANNQVCLNWFHDEDDDTMFEFGQELRDDFGAIDFRDCPVAGA
jgi:hypothetical protein